MGNSVSILTAIWQDVLRVDHVDPDDDFFSLGGDSLLAIKVIGAAQEKGLSLTLLDLFKNPTPRGACATLADGKHNVVSVAEMLSPLDQARLPDGVADAYPATRLQLGLIFENLLSDGGLYLDVISRTINLPLEEDVLRHALARLSERHPLLRTRFDLASFSEPMQLVERIAPIPLETTKDSEYEQVITRLAEPYDPERAPLLRVHASGSGKRSFRLSYSFHHAIMDGWSEAIFFNELVRTYASLLDETELLLPAQPSYAEFVRQERAALHDDDSLRYVESLRAHLAEREDPAAPLPGHHDGNTAAGAVHRKASAEIAQSDAELLADLAARWRLPVKSLLLAATCAAVGTVWATGTPIVGLLLNGRPERTGADLTLGLFLNQLPLRLDLADASWRTASSRALEAENSLLPHRRFPYAEVRRLLGRDVFDVTFNYVHFHPRDEILASSLVASDEDMRDHTSLPIRVEAQNDLKGQGLSLHVTVDVRRLGDALPGRLLDQLMGAVDRLLRDDTVIVSL
jgi:aryl carrier-like protein